MKAQYCTRSNGQDGSKGLSRTPLKERKRKLRPHALFYARGFDRSSNPSARVSVCLSCLDCLTQANRMLHARLSTRPTSFRKSNITAVSEYPPQLDDDNSNYTANLRDCVLALGDCGKQVGRPCISAWISKYSTPLTNLSRRHKQKRFYTMDVPTFLGSSAWFTMKQ